MLDAPPLRRAARRGLEVELRAIRTAGRRWPAHWHADLQLLATVDGCGEAYIEGQTFLLPRGVLLMIPPLAVHTAFEAYGAQGWTFLSLHAAPELVSGLERDLAPSLFGRDDPCAVAFRELVDRLSSAAADVRWRHLLDLLSAAGRTREREADATLTRWRARVGDVSAPNRTVTDLAEDLGLSRRSFERRFRDAFHLPPHRWRLIARVEAAKAALRGGASVAAAARRAGYADLRHFSRQFRQITGITARAYAGPFRSVERTGESGRPDA